MFQHAIYIGMVQIAPLEQNGHFKMEIRVFQNDFQDALRNLANKPVPINLKEPSADLKKWISSYFEAHIDLKINHKTPPLIFTQIEAVIDIYLIEFKFSTNESWDQVDLKADFLMELFPQQSNMVKLTHQGKTSHHRLTKTNSSLSQEI